MEVEIVKLTLAAAAVPVQCSISVCQCVTVEY